MSGEARQIVREADKKMKGGFMSCLAGTRRFEEAAELYEHAATQFKLAKDWQEAGNCYDQCVFCAQRTGSANDEANKLQEAGNMFKKISTAQAVERYELAIAILSGEGRFSQAGKLLLTIAELYEGEAVGHQEAKTYYKRAAEMFELDDHGKTSFTKCNVKFAEYAAKDGELQEAIKIFETEGEKALQSTLTQFGAKEYLFQAGLLHLAMGDSVTVNLAVERYCNVDPRFAGSREGVLLDSIARAFEAKDVDAFVDALSTYDTVTKLDAWKTDILVKVKDTMQPPAGLDADDFDLT